MFVCRRVQLRILLIALLFLMRQAQLAQAEHLPLKTYTVADRLASNEINKIVRDSRGFLWFCTAGGLSRFDGYAFTNYGTEQGLPHNNVTDILETLSGDYWIATSGGLAHFNPKGAPTDHVVLASASSPTPMFTIVLPDNDDDRLAKAVSTLLEGDDGTIWCGTLKGLRRLVVSQGRLQLQPVDIGMPDEYTEQRYVTDLLEDKQGSLWVSAPSGLYRRWPDGTFANYNKRDGLPDDFLNDLLEDGHGRMWAATSRGGFFQFAADASHHAPSIVRSYSARDGLTTNWVFQLFETSDGELKVATNQGLAEFIPDGDAQGNIFHLYTPGNGLVFKEITALNEDAGGNLWLGSVSGAMKLARQGFISYGRGDGLSWVGTLTQDQAGGVCLRGEILGDQHASVFDGGKLNLLEMNQAVSWPRLGRYDGRHFSWFSPQALKGVYYGWVGERTILQARNGEWWIGTGQGLYRFPPSDDLTKIKSMRPLAIYTTANKLAALQVFKIFEDSRGDVWASTTAAESSGLARWERSTDRWHDLAGMPGLPRLKDDLARSFGEDRAGNVWVGFTSGVARFQNGVVTFFTSNEGLPPGAIQQIYSDSAGRLWLTSARSGLIRVDDPNAQRPLFVNYMTAQGLSSNQLNVIVEDLNGDIYVGSDRGVDRFNPGTGRVKHYTTDDGLTPGALLGALRTSDGTLWFGTRDGLSRFTPTPEMLTSPPPVLISGLTIAGERQNISVIGESEYRQPDLAPDQNQIQIEFVGLSFVPGEVLRYQYKLEGADADWSALSDQRTVNYANLKPGAYRFLVRTVNSEGIMSATPAVIIFTVLHPFWQQWWFICLAALALCGVAVTIHRSRMRRLIEIADMRTSIATDLHDDIGADLTKIALLSEVARQQLGESNVSPDSPLPAIARISRDAVATMSDIVWAINPRRDYLRDLTSRMRQHAEEIFTLRNIGLAFNAPEESSSLRLSVEARRNLFLIFKEAVNNAARHSQCSRVEIDLWIEGAWLCLRVHDDGVGFDTSLESQGQGLMSMHRRVDGLGGLLEIVSGVGLGTTVSFRIFRARPPHGRAR